MVPAAVARKTSHRLRSHHPHREPLLLAHRPQAPQQLALLLQVSCSPPLATLRTHKTNVTKRMRYAEKLELQFGATMAPLATLTAAFSSLVHLPSLNPGIL